MNRNRLFAATLAVALLTSAGREVRATESPAASSWNGTRSCRTPFPGRDLSPRYYAITHIAMFDAINAIEREFEPYRVRLPRGPVARPSLLRRRPRTTCWAPSIHRRHRRMMPCSRSNSGPNRGFVRSGAAVGARRGAGDSGVAPDRWLDVISPARYSEPVVPGRWQPTPPNLPAAAFTHLQDAAPLALLSATQFLPPPPPSLTSEDYARDFNEVKLIGRVDSATRTAEQTAIARLWAGAGIGGATDLFAVWQNVARDVAATVICRWLRRRGCSR